MSQYVSNAEVDDVARRLATCRCGLVTTHAKPDGDAVGAVAALVTAIRRAGGRAVGRVMPPIPGYLEALMPPDSVAAHDAGEDLPEPDLVAVVDTGAWAQLEPMRSTLEAHVDRMVIVDHHLVGDVPARWRWINHGAAACCEMLVTLIEQMLPGDDPFVDPWIRNGLYAGIATDTGWFRFSNTHAGTLRAAARLLEAGVDHAALYQRFEQNARPAKLRLLSAALAGSLWLAGDRAVVMVLRREDFDRAEAEAWETERLVDVPQMVGSVEVVVLVTEADLPEDDAGRVRLSFRSKPGPAAVDVSRLAARFGGGGHARAAGGRQPGPLPVVVERLSRALPEALADVGKSG